MRKIYSYLKAGLAATLLFSLTGAANAASVPLGTHSFTADVEYMAGYEELATAFTLPNEFSLEGSLTRPSLENFIRTGSTSVYMNFDASSGTLSFVSANLGFYATPDYSFTCTVGVADINGNYSQTASTVKWTVDNDGHILIPDFTIVNINSGNAIMAKYTNCKVDGYSAGGGNDEPVTYPASVTGNYSFTGNMDLNPTYSELADQIPSKFDFIIEKNYIDGFVGYNGYLYYSYNSETGIIKITSNRLQDTSWYLPDTYMGVQLGLSDASGTWPGLKNTGGDIMEWQVNSDGTITIPEFTIVDRNNGNPVIARFTGCKVTGEGSEEPENPENPDTPDGPVNPEIGAFDVIGTYTLTIRPTDVLASTSQPTKEMEVQVIKSVDAEEVNGSIQYYLEEIGDTNYFNGNIIPFNYQSGTNSAVFEAYYAGKFGGNYTWFSMWAASSLTEPMAQCGITFSPETGFDFVNTQSKIKNLGFGWFVCSGEDNFDAQDLYSGFYLVDCALPAEPVTYPAAGEFDGYYKYTCPEFTLEDPTYANYFKSEVDFQVSTSFNQATGVGTVNILDFFVVNNGTVYNEETGELTLNSVYFKPDGSTVNFGIAPVEGGWTGMAGLYANKMKWQIGPDGSITVPDFDIVTFSGNTATATIAKYRSGTVTATDGPGGGDVEETSFEGTYAMNGTKYTYPDGIDAPAATEALNFDLVINSNNQITSIGGYTLSEEEINVNKRNQGIVEGNSLVLEAAPFNGVAWQQVPSPETGDESEGSTYTESYLLGGPNIKTWDQLDDANKVVFTKEEDGTYYLAPFTIWHRYPAITEDNNVQLVMELVFKWDDTPFSSVSDPSIEGYWNIPLNGHYQGSASMGQFTGKYDVTVNGETVNFKSADSSYSIVGKFIDETTVEFSRALIVPAKYALIQVPYINTTGTNEMSELEEQTFSAIYNAENGTLVFPEGSGILYGRFEDNVKLSFWEDAFDFAGIGKKEGDFNAEITIVTGNNGRAITWELDGTTLEASFAFEVSGFSVSDVANWKVQVTETFSDKEAEKDWTETSEVDAVVVNNVASFTLTDLTSGNHDLTIALVAYDSQESAIATSNSKALSFVVGPSIAIRAPQLEIDNNTVTVTFDATFSGFNAGAATYKAVFTDNTTVTDDYAGDTMSVDATVEDGVVTAILSDLEKGTYNLSMVLEAYNEDEAIATSNKLELNVFTITTTGIENIDADAEGVRYFNLQGIEVANPEKGQILIKVEGNKTSKVFVK